MALSDFGMTKSDAEYILGSLLHSTILEILAYGIYTSVYCVAMYLIRKLLTSQWLPFVDIECFSQCLEEPA